jgi:hypothetical protein
VSLKVKSRTPLIATILLMASQPLASQEVEPAIEAGHRNNCRIASQVLTTGEPHPRLDWARRQIGSCPNEAPTIWAASWRSIGPDSAAITHLLGSSSRFRDSRLYVAAREVVADASRPEVVRVGAMLLLARYVEPGNAIVFQSLRPPVGQISHIPVITDSNTGSIQMPGGVPLSGSVGPAVLALLAAIAADRDSEPTAVWYAAAVLSKRLEADLYGGVAQ